MNYALDSAIADSHVFASVSKYLRKDSRSVHNRLNSIAHDSEFVLEVAAAYDLPLVANERCGRWYISPDKIEESVYFKSTDGHTGQWNFSTRRLNLHIIDLAIERGGVVIVDSTRRGKRMPDSLSKTIPIWCSVINRSLFASDIECGVLHLPRQSVPSSERAQIESRMDEMVESFVNSGVDLVRLKSKLDKPLRPIWVTPDPKLVLPSEPPKSSEFYTIVLCTASRMVLDGSERRLGYTYVQGAADDHEEWASTLTPTLFWSNKELLLTASDLEVEELLQNKALKSTSKEADSYDVSGIGESGIWIGRKGQKYGRFQYVIDLSTSISPSTEDKGQNVLRLSLPDGKKGSKRLRTELASVTDFYTRAIDKDAEAVLIVCNSGSDFAVGAALTIMALYHDDDGKLRADKSKVLRVDKDTIRKRLTFIITQRKVNPSRATLQAVNAFLMS
ncbi:tRNA A64-2'-O-ribosylphosphate transferase [Lipomyces arxii]|uniref:tRNA A64-2'-O-ribosylphosphate transferase n=1 Tax=Lipomyces arxii TaxID=56418 RepID=UPI0034CEB861